MKYEAGVVTLGVRGIGALVFTALLMGYVLGAYVDAPTAQASMATAETATEGRYEPRSPRVRKLQTPPRTYSRDEFRSLAIGKTPHQLIDVLGRPNRAREWMRPDGITGMEVHWRRVIADDLTGGVTGITVFVRDGVIHRTEG